MRPIPAGETVFNGMKLRATLYDGQTGTLPLVVRFDALNAKRSGFAPAAPIRSLWQAGHPILTVQTAANDWYVNSETFDLDQALYDLSNDYPGAHLLGFSMGGYAAFRFAKVLDAAWITAISPQYSIHPNIVPFDIRYQEYSPGFEMDIGRLKGRAVRDLQGAIFFDPFLRRDRRHAAMIQGLFPAVRLLRLPGGGHPANRVLGQMSTVSGLIESVARGAAGAFDVHRCHRNIREDSPIYWQNRGRKLNRSRPTQAKIAKARASSLAETMKNAGG